MNKLKDTLTQGMDEGAQIEEVSYRYVPEDGKKEEFMNKLKDILTEGMNEGAKRFFEDLIRDDSMDELKKRVIWRKERFVSDLNDTLPHYLWFEEVSYRYIPEKDLEFVRILYKGNGYDIINVTHNSEAAILKEIALRLSGDRATGLICDWERKEELNRYFTEEED